MRQRIARAVLALATFAVVWLVVSPAHAFTTRAPICDPRGAIGFAPPPQIQDAETSLDIPADCFDVSPLETKNVVPGRSGPLDISFSQEPACTTKSPLSDLIFTERLPLTREVASRPPPGIRRSLDRPPRG